ncbi:MAG: hypothetical protein CMJ20_02620 [Phycisphaeraceae bacterium]|nr:hypothetical protein [Phycisphaeraceae bacterium]|tara:strand:- start:757 stop:1245 length:489 start_codon:yes stop_codon:yes gene_type:complete
MIISGDKIAQKNRPHVRGATSKHAAKKHLAALRAETRAAVEKSRSVVLIMGLPGAGKSTHAAAIDAPGLLVIDTCAPTPAHREPLIRAARRAKIPIDCVFIDTPIRVCEARRPKIPQAELYTIKAKLARPRKSEGFRAVCYIQGSHDEKKTNTTHAIEGDRS